MNKKNEVNLWAKFLLGNLNRKQELSMIIILVK